MKIFVTGGSGFVGSPLLHYLRQQGHEVGALARSPEAIAAPQSALLVQLARSAARSTISTAGRSSSPATTW